MLHYPPLSEGDSHVPDQLQEASTIPFSLTTALKTSSMLDEPLIGINSSKPSINIRCRRTWVLRHRPAHDHFTEFKGCTLVLKKPVASDEEDVQ